MLVPPALVLLLLLSSSRASALPVVHVRSWLWVSFCCPLRHVLHPPTTSLPPVYLPTRSSLPRSHVRPSTCISPIPTPTYAPEAGRACGLRSSRDLPCTSVLSLCVSPSPTRALVDDSKADTSPIRPCSRASSIIRGVQGARMNSGRIALLRPGSPSLVHQSRSSITGIEGSSMTPFTPRQELETQRGFPVLAFVQASTHQNSHHRYTEDGGGDGRQRDAQDTL